VAAFLEGLPRRYLQLVEAPDPSTTTSRWRATFTPDDVHLRLGRAHASWELTASLSTSPMLFANICGVLSSFGTGTSCGATR
jgi:hypothetical protein